MSSSTPVSPLDNVDEGFSITTGSSIEKAWEGCGWDVSLHTIMGRRKTQEDRFLICPKLSNKIKNVSIFGVFDGTVGDFASDTVKDLVVTHLRKTSAFKELEEKNEILDVNDKMSLLKECVKTMYSTADQELLRLCGKEEKHYATCTSVTLLLWQDFICVGHLGDSRVCLVYSTNENLDSLNGMKSPFTGPPGDPNTAKALKEGKNNSSSNKDAEEGQSGAGGGLGADTSGSKKVGVSSQGATAGGGESSSVVTAAATKLPANIPAPAAAWAAPGSVVTRSLPASSVESGVFEGNFVTKDHKPDTFEEKNRIFQSGGSVEYLQNHQNKPFIRGGDFQQRKLLGESPMQLQYSRAFGGKDLKVFGLSSEPTINVTKRERQFLGFLLGSDGLWDVCTADQASKTAMRAHLTGQNGGKALVESAMDTSGDNITAMTVIYDSTAGDR